MVDATLLEQWGIAGPTARGPLAAAARAGEIVSTWEIGQEQTPRAEIRRFVTDGYAENSLIYACIREKATSFASLAPQMTKPDGQIIETDPMLRLMRDPNTYQDTREFQEEIVTHLDVAGNAYVAKVRESSNRARRAEWSGSPVQELQAIRPDKVTIKPGRGGRMTDTYLVKADGRVRMEIPADDLVHIKYVNPREDFYGLPPLELLVREGTVDLTMSDFQLSFFRNAGVPAGLLTVKGRPSTEETAEIKGAFRSAFSGIKSWFDVLVLNDKVTKYEPLAVPPAQMGTSDTRDHVESRICSVLGVPGQLVGARFTMSATGSHSYEQNQFQFWSETMVPLSMRVAGAFQKQLHPDFATRQSRTNEFGYDYTDVRALQEDRSRKLREVVRMINTGGVTVADAFVLAGLDPPRSDAEFYIRSANQAEVAADAGDGGEREVFRIDSTGEQTPEADNPLEGAALMPVRPSATTKRVVRDDAGRIIRIVEEAV